jgi:hypothetical protein
MSETTYGPHYSERALGRAHRLASDEGWLEDERLLRLRVLADAMHDPALGEQRSVCLADVVAVLQEWRGDRVIVGMDPATYVAERMTGWNGIDAR